jgi:hypothetical protein
LGDSSLYTENCLKFWRVGIDGFDDDIDTDEDLTMMTVVLVMITGLR